MTDTEYYREAVFQRFAKRYQENFHAEKVDNSRLHAGSDMYFYCKDCGILIEKLPEDYLLPPYKQCSQCSGMEKEGLLAEAKRRIVP